MPLRSLYADLNSFFAAVEQQDNPALRGRPVAVVPMITDNTSVLAASVEAKRLGIKTGTRVRDAKAICPDIALAVSRTERYVEVHHAVIAAVDQVLPIQRVWSIDEVCCKLGGPDQEQATAVRLAKDIKRSIKSRVGEWLTCSIGIAPNRWLAKVASDMQKPDGLVVITSEELPARLHALALTDFPGIGPRMHTRMLRAGIATVEELCARSEKELVKAFGSRLGSDYYHWLRGAPISDGDHPKRSVGHEHVLGPEKRTQEGARAVLIRLVTKAAARLRAYGLVTGELTIAVRMMGEGAAPAPGSPASLRWGMAQGGASGWHHRVVLQPPTGDSLTLTAAVVDAWAQRPEFVKVGAPIKVAATLNALEPAAGSTGSLFSKPAALSRVSKAIDTINAKYGKNAVYVASMHQSKQSAPSRIAFSSVPEMDV